MLKLADTYSNSVAPVRMLLKREVGFGCFVSARFSEVGPCFLEVGPRVQVK